MSTWTPEANNSYKVKQGDLDAVIGNDKVAGFLPVTEVMVFDDLRIKLEYDTLDTGSLRLTSNKVTWVTPDEEVEFTPTDMVTQFGLQGSALVINIVLKSQPTKSEWKFNISGDEVYNWYYQPSLIDERTQAEHEAEWGEPVTVTENDVTRISDGHVVDHRPEHVVGSYAVYHKTKKDNQYKTGKAFHVFRPKVTDDNGVETWGVLHYGTNVLTVTVDPDWLKTAAYPVVIDPDIGRTALGASDSGVDAYYRGAEYAISGIYMVFQLGYAGLQTPDAADQWRLGVWDSTFNDFTVIDVIDDTGEVDAATDGSIHWENSALSYTLDPVTVTQIVIAASGSDSTVDLAYDIVGGAPHKRVASGTGSAAIPDPATFTEQGNERAHSVYVNYDYPEDNEDLFAKFELPSVTDASVDLFAEFEVQHTATKDLYAEFEIQDSNDLFADFYVQNYQIFGTTYDKNGAVLGSVVVKAFKSSDDSLAAETTSNAGTGVYVLTGLENTDYYLIHFKSGAPDVWGTSSDITSDPI